jgi:hypothetical protein
MTNICAIFLDNNFFFDISLFAMMILYLDIHFDDIHFDTLSDQKKKLLYPKKNFAKKKFLFYFIF